MPYMDQRLTELSADLCLWEEVDGQDTGLSGDQGLQEGRLLPKTKARIDAYHVGKHVFSFVATCIDTPQRACELK